MSSIDEKFKKVIAESASPEEVKEDAATGDTAIKNVASLHGTTTDTGKAVKELLVEILTT